MRHRQRGCSCSRPDSLRKRNPNQLPRPGGGPRASAAALHTPTHPKTRVESRAVRSSGEPAPLLLIGSAPAVSAELHTPGSVVSHRHSDVMAHCSQ